MFSKSNYSTTASAVGNIGRDPKIYENCWLWMAQGHWTWYHWVPETFKFLLVIFTIVLSLSCTVYAI